MKTIIKTLFVAIALVATSFANVKANNPSKTASFEVGIYQTTNTLKLNLMVEKQVGNRLEIAIKNDKGEVLYTETIAKNDAKYHGKFDFSQLGDGQYSVEISAGKEKIVKNINLSTNTPEPETNRSISMN
jgi:hypothetical protein